MMLPPPLRASLQSSMMGLREDLSREFSRALFRAAIGIEIIRRRSRRRIVFASPEYLEAKRRSLGAGE